MGKQIFSTHYSTTPSLHAFPPIHQHSILQVGMYGRLHLSGMAPKPGSPPRGGIFDGFGFFTKKPYSATGTASGKKACLPAILYFPMSAWA
jgi:hypothetical protein